MSAAPVHSPGPFRGFTHTGAAWYGKSALNVRDAVDEIMIGLYYEGGGTDGEFAIRWTQLGGKLTPRLECFDDAWKALAQFKDLLEVLEAHSDLDPPPLRMCELLKELGIRDQTERVSPYAPKPTAAELALKADAEIAELRAALRACVEVFDYQEFTPHAVILARAALSPTAPATRFPMTYCSQCGDEQGPGDEGVSSCRDHRRSAS